MKSITFITGNLNKVKWTQRYSPVMIEHTKLDLTEVQSLDVKEVVEHKVKEAYSIIKKPVIVEDTSLVFHSLGKLPGPLIKWFLQELGLDRLCKIITDRNRKATATVVYGLFDGKNLRLYEGSAEGSIAKMPKGDDSFGWNPIFIPKGYTKTYGEMTVEEIDKFSIRKKALEKMGKELTNKQ